MSAAIKGRTILDARRSFSQLFRQLLIFYITLLCFLSYARVRLPGLLIVGFILLALFAGERPWSQDRSVPE